MKNGICINRLGSGFKAALMVMLLLMLQPVATHAGDWYLELDRIVHLVPPDVNFEYEFDPGSQKATYERPGYSSINTFKFSEPPRVIKAGDNVELTFSVERVVTSGSNKNKQTQRYYDATNGNVWGGVYYDPNNTPKDGARVDPNKVHGKSIQNNVKRKFYDSDGPNKSVTFVYPEDYMMDPHDPRREAREGQEFIIYFTGSNGMSTDYVYKYRPGKSASKGAVPFSTGDKGGIGLGAIAIILIGSGGAGVAGIILILGGAGAAAGEEDRNNPNLPTPPRPSDPYVVKLPDGTIEYTNPVTLERDYYPPDTDEGELREQVEHVLRNRDYYKGIQDKHDQWTREQRAQIERELRERQEAYNRAMEQKATHENYVNRLMEKYGVKDEEELRDKISEAMAKAELEYWDNIGDAQAYDESYKFAENTKIVADVAMDGLAALGGKKGAMVRDAYKALAEISQTMVDAGCRGKDLGEAAAVGITRAGITYIQYQTLDVGVVPHLGATVVGEGMRDAVTALYEGKSPQEVADAYIKGSIRGAENFAVDAIVGGTVKGVTGSPLVMNSADYKTATKIVNSIGNVTDDVGKLYFDNKLDS